ncbi:hypothetical protein [Xenorhabdus bovienii]|uniref:hypothetical protein n=1 Tax=Xenorhabdus bovienii TaxID=40576 RepID=UPI0004DA1E40|nr:hypothetical protein [Xenorhabdus bovienii]CDG88124.1 conserved hypothetical protein [Xenorhabdus bovienii str. feltiae France]CDG91803.1 conserved hypothetical protein [Xenorhabdus bovienii str. feltiae Florida]
MEVNIKLNKSEVNEYLNTEFNIQEGEYSEIIQSDIGTMLRTSGFQWVKNSDVSVIIN